jgi:hypothetical protein
VKRIIYVGKEKGDSRSYVSESPALLRNFFEHYKVPKGAAILSDIGGSFVDQGKSVLLYIGFQRHVCYPAVVHQYLSPNDNRMYGTAKKIWRESYLDCNDDVKSCLFLLHRLYNDIRSHIYSVEVLEIFQQHQDEIHCVLSDLKMPRMNG